MKIILFFVMVTTASAVFAQSTKENEVLELSGKIFSWEVGNKINLLAGVLNDKFSVVTSHGEIQNKEQYLKTLSSGNFKHDSITVEQRMVTLVNNTATVIGKGWFHMSVSGNKLHRHLSYMEVFVKEDKGWQIIALYASALPDQ